MGLVEVEYGAVASLAVVVVLFLVMDAGIHQIKLGKTSHFNWILRSFDDGHYSLTSFQFISWTGVLLLSIVWIYAVRIQGNVLGFISSFPASTLALMGISTGSAIGATAIEVKRSMKPPKDETVKGLEQDVKENKDKFWYMLYVGEKPDLTRVQLFAWTIVSLIIYLGILFSQMFGPYVWGAAPIPLESLTIPSVDPSLLTLMGLSQTAFIAGKIANTVPKGEASPVSGALPTSPQS